MSGRVKALIMSITIKAGRSPKPIFWPKPRWRKKSSSSRPLVMRSSLSRVCPNDIRPRGALPSAGHRADDAHRRHDGFMDFSLSAEQEAIKRAIEKVCARFPDDYWLKKDRDGGFPHDFHRAFAADGWLGVCIPQAYGGAGLGVTEAAIMMQAI